MLCQWAHKNRVFLEEIELSEAPRGARRNGNVTRGPFPPYMDASSVVRKNRQSSSADPSGKSCRQMFPRKQSLRFVRIPNSFQLPITRASR